MHSAVIKDYKHKKGSRVGGTYSGRVISGHHCLKLSSIRALVDTALLLSFLLEGDEWCQTPEVCKKYYNLGACIKLSKVSFVTPLLEPRLTPCWLYISYNALVVCNLII